MLKRVYATGSVSPKPWRKVSGFKSTMRWLTSHSRMAPGGMTGSGRRTMRRSL